MKSYEEWSKARKQAQLAGNIPDWYTTQGYQMFHSGYALPGEGDVKQRFKTIADTLAKYTNTPAYWNAVFFQILWKGWFSPATPVLTNTGNSRGMPVSCAGQYIDDSIEAFYSNLAEAASLCKQGFGCSATVDPIRPRGSDFASDGKANGPWHVIEDLASMAQKVSQGSSRRGSIASYINIESPDFWEIADKIQDDPSKVHIGWVVEQSFIDQLQANDREMDDRFKKAIYLRLVYGRGYFFFKDKANKLRPLMYQELGLEINNSNLCTEIMLFNDMMHTFSCILGSVNAAKYDEWKDTNLIQYATVFMDCVVSYFLDKSKNIPGMEKVRRFTEKGRAIGIGVVGLSEYLIKNRIPFDSIEALSFNNKLFRELNEKSLIASKKLALELGEPEWCKGHGVRHTHRTAVAPTKSTSTLMGNTSESVFPYPGIAYDISSAKGEMPIVVGEFYRLAKERGMWSTELATDIVNHLGSVQHLDWLTDHEKLVFRTAFELDQHVLIRYASNRQKYLCQGQSLNFYIRDGHTGQYVAELHKAAFLNPNILSLYYIHSQNGVVIEACQNCAA